METLQACDLNKVKTVPSTQVFRFGREEIKKSLGQIILPYNLAGKDIFAKNDIVDSNIPLLLSKQSWKTASLKLNLENDTTEIWENNGVRRCKIRTLLYTT